RRVQGSHRLFAGGWSGDVVREVFERGHAAAVLPYDPARDAVVLIEQFRIGAFAAGEPAWLTEVIAGIVEEGETPDDVARREAVEEAGLTIAALEPVTTFFVSPGGTTQTTALFVGRVDSAGVGGIHGLDEEHEDIRASTMSFDDAMAMGADGRIREAATLIALQWLALNRDRLRTKWK
ncbi:MAG: NUDIX domain-containing protein, partial [Rhodospirillaceae bacterium]|nr:NUDIX domain-containing protein [Rhodospirillaceae bacterium]